MSISQTSSNRDVRVAPDAAAAFRDDFVRVVARIGLDSDQAASLAEAMSGRRFEACCPEDLAPALSYLAALAERIRVAQFSRSHSCDD